MARRHGPPTVPYQTTPAAGDAFASNSGLRARNVASEESANANVQDTFGDPMHALALNNAQQSLLNARTDVNGMGAVLQGIKEATHGRTKVGFQEPSAEDPSAMSPASWNPAGMTQDAAQADATRFAGGLTNVPKKEIDNFARGGLPPVGLSPLPSWYSGAQSDTQDAFRRRVLQGIKGAHV